MITLVVAIGLFIGLPQGQATKPAKPQSIQLQEKIYPLTKAMEVSGDETVLDGHGATLQGSGSGVGLHIGGANRITIKNLKIVGFTTGLSAQGSTELTLTNVAVSKSTTGIRLEKTVGGLAQGVQVHSCETGMVLAGCTKLLFEKGDLSQNSHAGISVESSASCIIRDNRIVGVGENPNPSETPPSAGIFISNGSDHNQVLRNLVAHCRSFGINVTSVGNQPSTDNTFEGNDVSWTVGGVGLAMSSETENKLFDNTAGFCKIGIQLTGVTKSMVKGNLLVGNSECGIADEMGVKNTYDTNVFVAENGGPVAIYFKGTESASTDSKVLQNVFMGYQKPIRIENANPLTLQGNGFPGVKSVELGDIATIIGKRPVALGSQNEKPRTIDFVPGNGFVAQIPTIYDRIGGVGLSSTHVGDFDLVVEGSLSGAFQGEEEVLAKFKGPMPVDLTFPPRFEMFVRVRQIAEKPVYLALMALLGDNSMAKDKPADDSGDTLFKPGLAVDGDTTTLDNAWSPPKGRAGEWWEVDVRSERTMTAFSVLPLPTNPDGFWQKFHISVSSSGLFKGEETTVVTETDWSKKPGPERVYSFPPCVGRYIRIYGDVDQQGVQLKQFGVYGVKQ